MAVIKDRSANVLIDDIGGGCFQVRCTRCERDEWPDALKSLSSWSAVTTGRPPGWVGWTPEGFDRAVLLAEKHVWQHRIQDDGAQG